MNDCRWETSIHEAGHCVVAHVLGGKPASVEVRDGGLVMLGAELPPSFDAFVVAAGPVAVELFGDEPPPAEQSCESEQRDEKPIGDFHAAKVLARHGTTVAETPSDERQLALWAIAGREHEPDKWAERIYWARWEATKLATQNRDRILRLAAALYQRGSLLLDEITTAMEESK